MHKLPSASPAICLSAVVAVGLPSQSTFVVGPGGLPQIRDALALAAPGDLIDVLPGIYSHFSANVGVAIRAVLPGTVLVAYDRVFMTPGCNQSLSCLFSEGQTHLAPPAGLSRCTYLSTNPTCPTVPVTPGFLLGVTRPSPLSPGGTFALDFTTEPNGFVAVFASQGPAFLDVPGLLAEPSFIDNPQAFVAGLALADGFGAA